MQFLINYIQQVKIKCKLALRLKWNLLYIETGTGAKQSLVTYLLNKFQSNRSTLGRPIRCLAPWRLAPRTVGENRSRTSNSTTPALCAARFSQWYRNVTTRSSVVTRATSTSLFTPAPCSTSRGTLLHSRWMGTAVWTWASVS